MSTQPLPGAGRSPNRRIRNLRNLRIVRAGGAITSQAPTSPARDRKPGWRRTAMSLAGPPKPEPEHRHWHTMGVDRTVLVAVHTITSLIRLDDLVTSLEEDPRVQLIYTQVPDRFGEGVDKRLRDMEVRVIPWEEATSRVFDLVVAACLHRLEDLPANARFAAAHGAGYNKLWPAWAWPGGGDDRPVYGLDRASLLHEGTPVVDALILPHPDHLTTLKRQCPESVQNAVVAGDPCYDRFLACRAQQAHYRQRLGIRDGQVLVAVSSTWGQNSLLARHRDLLVRLASELPNNHRVIATVHPAVWAEHGPRQVRTWFREAHNVGLNLVDAYEDWRGLLAAADFLVADHSSLSAYAAGAELPVLFSHFAEGEVDANSIMAELAQQSPRLQEGMPLVEQLAAARDAQVAQRKVTYDRLAARKGMSAEIVRETLYRQLGLPEMPQPARWPLVPEPRLADL